MTKKTAEYKKVWECDASWWQSNSCDFVLGDSFHASPAEFAGINSGDHESWCCKVVSAGEHTLIRPGDFACSDGIGCDVIFVRPA